MDTAERAMTIFLIDDDDIDVMAIERCFKKQGITHPIIRAEDGMQALEMLETAAITQPFVILLDLNMPRMNGIEFLNRLRQDSNHRRSVVFVLTTSQDDQDVIRAYDHFVAGYFLKNQSGGDFSHLALLIDEYSKMVELPGNIPITEIVGKKISANL
jgi:CheY-like chemotaxis protein